MAFTRYGVELGPLTIGFFGLIVAVGLAAGGALAALEARRRGLSAAPVLDLLTAGLVLGVVVGRLFYIWNPPPSVAAFTDRRWFLTHPFDLQIGPLAVWSGGLGIAGVLLGALLAFVFVIRRQRLDAWQWADIVTPGFLLGLAILPWANLVNEQMMGPPTGLPWGLALERRVLPFDDRLLYPAGMRFHPTPAYVSVWSLAVLGAVLAVRRFCGSRLRPGDLFLLAGALITPGLFLADFLRVDVSRPLPGLSGMQLLCLALLIGLAALTLARRRGDRQVRERTG